MKLASRLVALAFVCLITGHHPTQPRVKAARNPNSTYGPDELVGAGHQFFGNVSRGLASVIEKAVSNWGLPNGYVLGEEGAGAFVAGLRYGEGTHLRRMPAISASTGRVRPSASTGAAPAPAP